ncbi:MAG: DUF128 domain-containing protein [Deltaproteobacteria bacterium]|nr:DUF128 domain-containing protein [Deltaproteobacteria bacterium]
MIRDSKRKVVSILNVLQDSEKSLGGSRIARKLEEMGFDLSQRTVRYYLQKMDGDGLTVNLGKKGRRITPKGEEELRSAFIIEKVGFVAAKIDTLAYQMNFSMGKRTGNIILNLSLIREENVHEAFYQMQSVFKAGLGMGRFLALGVAGTRIGNFRVDKSMVAIGTVCSVTLNGIFLSQGINTTSRFGGLLELVESQPVRFTQIINYDGSSIDPLEIFIKGGMTSVAQAAHTGSGKIGASFREVPSVAIPKIQTLRNKLDSIGLSGILMLGKPGQPLLDIPVSAGRAGMIVAGGLNPLAAVEESGIKTENMAMGTLLEFSQLIPFYDLKNSM